MTTEARDGLMKELDHAQRVTKKSCNPEGEPGCTFAMEHLDRLLDEALEESFPARDPPCIGGAT